MKKPWDLKINVAIVSPRTPAGAGRVKAVALAELTVEAPAPATWTLDTDGALRAPRADCHQCQKLSALFPPGDSGAVAGDLLKFGGNVLVIDAVETVGEGAFGRRRYRCTRAASAADGKGQ